MISEAPNGVSAIAGSKFTQRHAMHTACPRSVFGDRLVWLDHRVDEASTRWTADVTD